MVSASLRNGKLAHALITSEAGLPCTMHWPWGVTVTVTDAVTGAVVAAKPAKKIGSTDRLWRFETSVGQSFLLS